jgi:hypothetical protein
MENLPGVECEKYAFLSADTSREEWLQTLHEANFPWVAVIAEPKGWG